MFTVAAFSLFVLAAFSGGEYVGSKTFEDQDQCQEFREQAVKVYPGLQITECIEVPVLGSGVSPERNEAP